MAVLTIAGLTLKEAVRRKTLVGALLLGLLVLGLSFILIPIHAAQHRTYAKGIISLSDLAVRSEIARSAITSLCLSSIKSLSALFAVLLAGGAVSGEIERGLLAVILPKPLGRWQILLGKWIGLMLIIVVSVLVWTAMVWASISLQTRRNDQTPILHAGLYLALFPVLVGTLSLTFSTFAQRQLGTALALTVGAFSWFDGIFNALGNPAPLGFDVPILKSLAVIAGLAMPQGYVGQWVENVMASITVSGPRGRVPWESPQFLSEWGEAHLRFARLDVVYFVGYVVVVFLIGVVVFQKRDV